MRHKHSFTTFANKKTKNTTLPIGVRKFTNYATNMETNNISKVTFMAMFLGHPKGSGGFLRPVDTKGHKDNDWLLNQHNTHNVIHGDLVQVKLIGKTSRNRYIADIIKIVSRNQNPIPAILNKQGRNWVAVPLEPKITQPIYLDKVSVAKNNDIISVKLNNQVNSKKISGSVVARLGKLTELKIENKITAATFNLNTQFSSEVMAELTALPDNIQTEWLANREDLRNILTVTIDPNDAKDFDDAISIKPLANASGGWLLGVHIADVSYYVKEGSPLDQEALARGTSVYFPDQCIPMLPEQLSGNLCSLIENADRLTITIWLTINSDYTVQSTRISESIIRSNKRLTYDQVKQACLDFFAPSRAALGPDLCQLLEDGLKIASNLTRLRIKRGAININSEEVAFKFDNNDRVIDAHRRQHHAVHNMIEEFMLLANEAVANLFTNKELPIIYRIHDTPDPVKLAIFKETVNTLIPIATNPTLNELLNGIKGNELEVVLNDLLVRSLKRAEYSTDNIGHFGLALENYLHFTSPIRRYPDLMVHRILRKVLNSVALPRKITSHLQLVAKSCSILEQNAAEAERDNKKRKSCLLMADKIGQQFSGQIIGLSSKAIFIQIDNPFVEVSASLIAMSRDFITNQNCTKAMSRRLNLTIAIGNRVKVIIATVDKVLHRINAQLLAITTVNDQYVISKSINSYSTNSHRDNGYYKKTKKRKKLTYKN